MKNLENMPISPLFAALAICLGFSLYPSASAAEDDNLPAAVNRVERETGGRVLSAERRHQSGREINRIKVYTPEGRMRVMWDEPRGAPSARAAREAAAPPEHRPPPQVITQPRPVGRERR